MRVLVVIDSLGQGGAEQSLVGLLPHLHAAGIAIEVVTLGPDGALTAQARATGATVVSLGAGPRRTALARLRRRVVDCQPDLVHTMLFEANVIGRAAGRLARVPVVSSLVSTPYGPDHFATSGISASKLRMSRLLDQLTARLVRRFHAVSNEVATVMAQRLRIDPQVIDVIPRGRDPLALGERTRERRARVRRSLGLNDDEVFVLALARHEHLKGLDVLVKAAPRVLEAIPPVVIAVAGREGNATVALRRLVEASSAATSIRLLGYRDDVADLLTAADVFVLPSRREGFPGSVLEAMALRAPIVATDVPGTREALGLDTGLIVPVDDVGRLAEAVVATVQDSDGAAVRVERARRRFEEQFTMGAVAEQMVRFYERALVESSSARVVR